MKIEKLFLGSLAIGFSSLFLTSCSDSPQNIQKRLPVDQNTDDAHPENDLENEIHREQDGGMNPVEKGMNLKFSWEPNADKVDEYRLYLESKKENKSILLVSTQENVLILDMAKVMEQHPFDDDQQCFHVTAMNENEESNASASICTQL